MKVKEAQQRRAEMRAAYREAHPEVEKIPVHPYIHEVEELLFEAQDKLRLDSEDKTEAVKSKPTPVEVIHDRLVQLDERKTAVARGAFTGCTDYEEAMSEWNTMEAECAKYRGLLLEIEERCS